MFWNPRSIRRLRDDLDAFKPDLVLVHNIFPAGSLQCYREITDRGIPLIQYIHNFRPFSVNGYCWVNGRLSKDGVSDSYWDEISNGAWQNSRIKTFWFAAVLKTGHLLGIWNSVTHWIAISDFTREKFITAGIESDKITTLRHGISISARTPPNCDESDRFVYIGRISEEKGLRILIEAWRKHEATRDDGRLVIAGSGPLVA
jgi:glycosyltransferase involved in cell wall biosynthesis